MRYNPENGHMDFPHAMEVLIAGRKIRRASWPSAFFYVFRQGDAFFVNFPTRNKIAPFFPDSEEMLAIDWMEVPE